MASNIESVPLYYGETTAQQRSYVEYAQRVAMTRDITGAIEENTDRSIAANALFTESINSRITDAQIANTKAIYNNTQEMIGAFNFGLSGVSNQLQSGLSGVSRQIQSGFSGVSRQIGEMSAFMTMGFAALNSAVEQSAQAICDKLDTMNDILNNPSLTKTRELYRRAVVSYNKGFYEEARDDLLEALKSNKTDYISWFLLGKTYLFGAGQFSTVIDLDAAVDALKNAAKYITPDANNTQFVSNSQDTELEKLREMSDDQKIAAIKLIREKTGWELREAKDYYETGVTPTGGVKNKPLTGNPARAMAAEMCFFLGLAQQIKAMDLLHAKKKKDRDTWLEQAKGAYTQSWNYSAQMLESLYNNARCKALLGDVQGAIDDLETVVLQDRNYCIKVYLDNDFSGVWDQFPVLINKLRKAAFIPAKKNYDYIKTMLSELTSLGGRTKVTIPSTFTEQLPYFDVLDFAKDFKRIIPIVEKALTEKKATVEKAEQEKIRLEQLTKARERGSKYQACISAGLHTVGLKTDGTVVTVGSNQDGQCNISGWCGIVAIAASYVYTVGLKADGTVVSVGNNKDGQCNVSDWCDIVAIAAGHEHIIGIKADGTVVAVGHNYDGRCKVSAWRDIVAIAAGAGHTVGLKTDGTVIAVGDNYFGQCNVSGWTSIIAITVTYSHTVGLKADGTVVAVGRSKEGQCNVSDWRDIVAIAAGHEHTIGIKADGTVVAVGDNKEGQCNVGDWKGIVAIAAGKRHTVGLKADGTLVAVGDNEDGRCNVSSWRDIGPVNKEKLLEKKRKDEEQRLEKERQEKAEREARAAKEKAEQEALEKRRKAEEQQRIEQSNKWAAQGLCRYCGGELGGLFKKKCKVCGREK